MKYFIIYILFLISNFVIADNHPKNSSIVYGNMWTCNSGYKEVRNKCEKLVVPPNATVYGNMWMCNSGYKQEIDKCKKFIIPSNASAMSNTWHCNSGYKVSGYQCVIMNSEEKKYEHDLIMIIGDLLKDRKIDGNEFDLGDVEKNCKVDRDNATDGDIDCRGYDLNFIERKCEADFYNYKSTEGDIDCRGYDLNFIENNCKVKMTSQTEGEIDCGIDSMMSLYNQIKSPRQLKFY